MRTSFLPKHDTDILSAAATAELTAQILYENIANQCQNTGLLGAAKYFRNEATHEFSHYRKVAAYMADRGVAPSIASISPPNTPVACLEDALNAALKAEASLGDQYKSWYKSAQDLFTQQFLLEFLEIQRTSIGEVADWIARLTVACGDECAILMIDQELGASV